MLNAKLATLSGNEKINGVRTTYVQHIVGGATEIHIPETVYTDCDDKKAYTDKGLIERWFSWFQSHTDYDKFIMETSNGRDYWILASCRKNIKKNRHQVLRLTKK